MKVVSAKQMARLESLAYARGCAESDFMQNAGQGIAAYVDCFSKENDVKTIACLCGKGNNAGDAYVAAVHLLKLGYQVIAYQLFPIEEAAKLCRKNHALFCQNQGIVKQICSSEDLSFLGVQLIIDGIFGTGFHGGIKEPIASIIRKVNASGLPVIAIDIPSGLNGDTGEASDVSVVATKTVFLGLPKTGFFLNQGWDKIGGLSSVDFGLPRDLIEESSFDFLIPSEKKVFSLMPKIKPSRHKYEAGYVVGLAGSLNMPGAALLSSFAALRGGAGIVRLMYPKGMEAELSAAPYELIKEPFLYREPQAVLDAINKASAVFIGPGMGKSPDVKKLLQEILPHVQSPIVIDADALTLLSEMQISVPKQAILTPHLAEMRRLLHLSKEEPFDRLFISKCQDYVEKTRAAVILKGGPSFVLYPGQPPHVITRGNPGMATAGSGDVLTGLLAALLAEKLTPYDAALLGAYLHGLAGESAAKEKTAYCMTASDIIECFPKAFSKALGHAGH